MARLELPVDSKVFYNPKMGINRDLAVLFIGAHFSHSKKLRLCDPTTGSGVRTARYLLETGNVAYAVAADRDPEAAELAALTIKLNALEDRTVVVHADVHTLLSQHYTDRFDVVDLDPFGSPTAFFDSALRATASDGVIAATATDMGPLSGARPGACIRKYGVWPVGVEFEKELAVRTLASCLVRTAATLELGIDIAFSHATDHYARLYAVVSKGRKAANESLTKLGYLSYCPTCLHRSESRDLCLIQTSCARCAAQCKVGGPFWLGSLWQRHTVESMIQRTPTLSQARISEVQKILHRVHEEIDSAQFYYTTGRVASVHHVKPPELALLIHSLRKHGYNASRTHFNPTGFRTNATLDAIVDSFRLVAEKPQP